MLVMALTSVDNSALLAVPIPLGMALKVQDLTGDYLRSDWLWSGWPPEFPQGSPIVTPVELGGGCGYSGDTGSVTISMVPRGLGILSEEEIAKELDSVVAEKKLWS